MYEGSARFCAQCASTAEGVAPSPYEGRRVAVAVCQYTKALPFKVLPRNLTFCTHRAWLPARPRHDFPMFCAGHLAVALRCACNAAALLSSVAVTTYLPRTIRATPPFPFPWQLLTEPLSRVCTFVQHSTVTSPAEQIRGRRASRLAESPCPLLPRLPNNRPLRPGAGAADPDAN